MGWSLSGTTASKEGRAVWTICPRALVVLIPAADFRGEAILPDAGTLVGIRVLNAGCDAVGVVVFGVVAKGLVTVDFGVIDLGGDEVRAGESFSGANGGAASGEDDNGEGDNGEDDNGWGGGRIAANEVGGRGAALSPPTSSIVKTTGEKERPLPATASP